MTVRFTQPCSTCGRRVEIRASLLGRSVACQHCGAEFVALSESDALRRADESHELMARVEEALERAQQSVFSSSELV